MIDRRAFIGAVGAACVAGVRMEAKKIQRLGMQLYTVRTEMEKDVDATLAKVAAIGYKEVEFAGYFKRTPAQIRDGLKKAGLTAPAAHVDYPSLAADKLPAMIEAAQVIGHRYLVNPWIDESLRKEPDIWKRVAETFNRAGAATQKAGIQFAYHNHHFEFAPVDGKLPYELLLEQCDPKLVKMELDLCWIAAAGKDPLEYFAKLPRPVPAGSRQGAVEEAGGRRCGADSERDAQPDRRRHQRRDRLEANLREVGAGRDPALLRRARHSEGSVREPEGQLRLSDQSRFLKGRRQKAEGI